MDNDNNNDANANTNANANIINNKINNETNKKSYFFNGPNDKKQLSYQIIRNLYNVLNIEDNFIKIFGLDKIIVPLFISIKNWLTSQFPELNKYIFREKLSSLTITYSHFISTYYNQQNNTHDYMVYRSILAYVYEKKPNGCKFSTNPNDNFMFFEPFDEVKINKYIWIVSRVTPSNTNCLYSVELISYNSSIDKINKFIRYCLDKFKNQIQNDDLIRSSIKYYKYLGMNNASHQIMYDEFNFIQTKTFNNIFFTEKENLVKKIKYFSENEDSYKELGIPWCMGILLYGKPGTGKTSCIKAIASMTQRHIIDIALSKIKTQKELTEIFYNTKINNIDIPFNKRLYVLDELDLILNKIKDRKLNGDSNRFPTYNQESNINPNINSNINLNPNLNPNLNTNTNLNQKNNYQKINYLNYNNQTNNKNIDQNQNNSFFDNDSEGVSLEHLLTIMDGTVEHCGSMFIATTNYIDLIDKALIRPGRFDVCLYLDNANDEIIIQMIKHFSLKHSKVKSKINHGSDSEVKSNPKSNLKSISINPTNKFTSQHKKLIHKYSTFEGKNIWSPAKISQICLTHIDSDDYFDNVVLNLEKNYEEQSKLL